MSKVTMPEPSAEITSMNNVIIFDLTVHGKRSGLSVGEKFITTAQAEAYADARVRDAIKKVMAATERFQDSEAAGVVRQIQDEIKMIMEDNQ